jgi:putative transposase
MQILPQLLKNMPGVKIEKIGFDKDHLHMLMEIPRKYDIASVIGKLKSQSGSQVRKKFKWLEKVFWKENIIWSPGYFVSSVGLDEETIKKYVENIQGRQDSDQLAEL